MATIVVGVDGSDGAQRALEWAAAEARLRSADLRVVHAYRTEWVYYPEFAAVRTLVNPADLAEQAKELVDRCVEQLGALGEGLTVTTEAINDANAAHALLEHAADAEMIVMGSRGLGGFGGLLLGSVSQKVVHHASVPVVIIPIDEEDEAVEA
jgi:nucleotide-binding universal stress UspA family protein